MILSQEESEEEQQQEEQEEEENDLIKAAELYPFTITETSGIIHIKDSKVDEFYEETGLIASSIQ